MYQNVDDNLSDLEEAFSFYVKGRQADQVSQTGSLLCKIFQRADFLIQAHYFGKIGYQANTEIQDADFLNRLGFSSAHLGYYDLAKEVYFKALAIQREIGDKSGEGTTLNNISQIFKARGDYETALTYLKDSLAIQREIGDKSGEGTTLSNIDR